MKQNQKYRSYIRKSQVNESGRSMLEMIAVIVLMLLLLLVGLWGFKNASLSARINTLNKDIATAVAQRRYQIAQSGTQKPHTLSGKVGSTEMTIENIVSAEKQGEFVIILKNQSQEVCEGLKKFNIFHVKNFKINGEENHPCVISNEMELYFSDLLMMMAVMEVEMAVGMARWMGLAIMCLSLINVKENPAMMPRGV